MWLFDNTQDRGTGWANLKYLGGGMKDENGKLQNMRCWDEEIAQFAICQIARLRKPKPFLTGYEDPDAEPAYEAVAEDVDSEDEKGENKEDEGKDEGDKTSPTADPEGVKASDDEGKASLAPVTE